MMNKFVRTKLYSGSIKDRLQKNIEMAKELGETLTWKQSKELLKELDKQEIWVNNIYQVNVLRGKDCDQYVHNKSLKGNICFKKALSFDAHWILPLGFSLLTEVILLKSALGVLTHNSSKL